MHKKQSVINKNERYYLADLLDAQECFSIPNVESTTKHPNIVCCSMM